MQEVVQNNMAKAQACQKLWYDKTARERQFKQGHQILMLPTTTSKFWAKWQGPYEVIKKVGKVNYMVDMKDRRKWERIFHVNMMKKWFVQSSSGYLMKEVREEGTEDEILTWDGGEDRTLRVKGRAG